MVIYTKRGDSGETSTFDESGAQRARVTKDSLIVEALGAIDELNSFLGVVKTQTEDQKLKDEVEQIQTNLLTIGSITSGSSLRFSKVQTKRLESLIDYYEGSLPVLKNFVIPGGTRASALLQYSRSLSRRAERRMVALGKTRNIKPQILTYLNRLSDALFMLARAANHSSGVTDEIWAGKKK